MSLNLAGNPVAAAVPDLRDRVLGLLPELEARGGGGGGMGRAIK